MEASNFHLKEWVWEQKRAVRSIFRASISHSELEAVRHVLEYKVPLRHLLPRVELI
jgi:GTP-sensing pleiotropic transcriptional regulator CodY